MKQVVDKISLPIERYNTKGWKITVKGGLDDTERGQIVNLDEGNLSFHHCIYHRQVQKQSGLSS